jgi:hypothetical protein
LFAVCWLLILGETQDATRTETLGPLTLASEELTVAVGCLVLRASRYQRLEAAHRAAFFLISRLLGWANSLVRFGGGALGGVRPDGRPLRGFAIGSVVTCSIGQHLVDEGARGIEDRLRRVLVAPVAHPQIHSGDVSPFDLLLVVIAVRGVEA